LETRELLTASSPVPLLGAWTPSDLPVYQAIAHQPIGLSVKGLSNQARINPQAPFVNNQGKIVSGLDRAGDLWTITVHGPGTVLVTDATPNDGVLDDDIDTIQLLNTNPTKTWVTGQTETSIRTPTDGTVYFNRLISSNGVKSVVLNGFTLTQTVTPTGGAPNYSNTGIFLLGGTQLLQFHDILGTFDTSLSNAPINIVIGDPATPLNASVQPTIRLDSIFNTVFDSTAASVPTTPQTTPSVNILVNGELKGLDIISSTQNIAVQPSQALPRVTPVTPRYWNPTLSPIASPGDEFAFPVVGTTGRTSVRATGIGSLDARGSLVNVTASRGAPFTSSQSGLTHIRSVHLRANADALGLDVNGPIDQLQIDRGLGNPTGSGNAATNLGLPSGQTGYPAAGLLGGQITATRIRRLKAGPANVVLQTATNPEFVQLHETGYPTYYPRAGDALSSVAITTSDSINRADIQGNVTNSEIKTGFDYPSYAAGLEGTRAKSRITRARVHGDLVNGVVSSTIRPINNVYNQGRKVAGPGVIQGNSTSALYVTGGVTPLGNQGAGFFAHRKIGYLPPHQKANRVNGSLVR
jgi:hypothetical protein